MLDPLRVDCAPQKADRALAFASGMAALSNILRVVPSGGHVVAGDDLYGGTSRLLSRVAPELGIEVSNVDTTDIEALRAAIRCASCALGSADERRARALRLEVFGTMLVLFPSIRARLLGAASAGGVTPSALPPQPRSDQAGVA